MTESEMKNVSYDDGSPSREWVLENKEPIFFCGGGFEMTDEQKREAVRIIKSLSSLRIPAYDLPADSFLEKAVEDIFALLAQIEAPAEDVREAVDNCNIPKIINVWANGRTPDSGFWDTNTDGKNGYIYERAATKPCGCEGLVEALEKISRMKTVPDHASNSFTLAIAHQLAGEALAQYNAGKKEVG